MIPEARRFGMVLADGVAPKTVSFEASPENSAHCSTVIIALIPQ